MVTYLLKPYRYCAKNQSIACLLTTTDPYQLSLVLGTVCSRHVYLYRKHGGNISPARNLCSTCVESSCWCEERDEREEPMLWAELWLQLGVASEGGWSLFPMGNKNSPNASLASMLSFRVSTKFIDSQQDHRLVTRLHAVCQPNLGHRQVYCNDVTVSNGLLQ